MTSAAPALPRTMLDAALNYARRGWPVFPLHSPAPNGCSCSEKGKCEHPAKHPRTRHGLKDATTDETTIRKWFTKWPNANIGLLTGGGRFVVLDIDPLHGGNVSLETLETERGPFPRTVTASTGGGGCHYLFADPGGLRNKQGVMPGMDVRADGGYIVAAPSIHASGGVYEWSPGCGPDDLTPVPMPDWLIPLLTGDAPRRERPSQPRKAAHATDESRGLQTITEAMEEREVEQLIVEAIEATQPKAAGQRERQLFEFARRLKSIPGRSEVDPINVKADRDRLKSILRQWHKRALSVIATKDFASTWEAFFRCWPKVKFPRGSRCDMSDVLARAKAATAPAEVAEYDDSPGFQLLACVCRELQRDAGDQPFFLACRTAGGLLGVDPTTASRWLNLLVQEGVLERLDHGPVGSRDRAFRYRYCGDVAPT